MPKHRPGRKARVAKLLRMPKKKLKAHVLRSFDDLIDCVQVCSIIMRENVN